jgi:glycosyltransferase involved in cell wall biosynthesis
MVAYTRYSTDARIRREAETLVDDGFKVLIITARNPSSPVRQTINGVDVRELNVSKYAGKSARAYLFSYLRFLFASAAACLRLLMKRELDVVHVHNLPDFLVFSGLVPRLFGCRVVLDVHDSVPETFATKFSNAPMFQAALRLEERLSAAVAHRVICVNDPQRDALTDRGISASKMLVSMNVPDPRIFAQRPTAPAIRVPDNGPFNLVCHGTMVERLGVDLIILALDRLRERIPEAKLHLWGGGDDVDRFQELAATLKLEDRVHFNPKGYPLERLSDLLRTMHVGIVGNRRSVAGDLMLPVKLLEYVALDVPAIVPRLKTIQHYFTDDMVLFYEPENIDSLADAIYSLYMRPAVAQRQTLNARTFLTKYGWERQGPELVAMYRALLEN